MKTILITAIVYSFSLVPTSSSTVYICESKTAYRYHFSKSCSGLKKCTHTIKQVTKEEASRLGYTACKLE